MTTAEAKKREGILEIKEESIRVKNELDKEIKENEDTLDINKELTSLKKEVYQIIGERTGHTIGETKNYCERETWFAAKEALDFGIINQICTWAEYSKSFVP